MCLDMGDHVQVARRAAARPRLALARIRRLREEGVTLDAIKQRLRLKLAEELLQPGARLKVSDVALRLGFSDVRSFRRAFIEWTGKSPDAWRRGPAARQEGNRSGIIPQPRSGGGR